MPGNPGIPILPRSPFSPVGPWKPGKPRSPLGPGRPSMPGWPCCPLGPWGPVDPGGPLLPFSAIHLPGPALQLQGSLPPLPQPPLLTASPCLARLSLAPCLPRFFSVALPKAVKGSKLTSKSLGLNGMSPLASEKLSWK